MSYLDLAKKIEETLKCRANTPPENSTPSSEMIAASILAENEMNEAEKIVSIWRKSLGLKLDLNKVREDLQRLRRWKKGLTRYQL